MILLCGVIGLVAIFLFCFAEHFFLLIGAGPELAAHSALILRRLSWAVPGDFAYDALARWMRGVHAGSAHTSRADLDCNRPGRHV